MDDKDADMQKTRISQRMQHTVPARKEHRSRYHRGLTLPAFLVSLLACSASAMGADVGLPELPGASGSSGSGGRYGLVPTQVKQVLTGLGCSLDDTAKARVLYVPGPDGRQDVMVTDNSGSAYHYWLRSFAGSGDTTGYLLQLKGCPASTVGMRAYIAHGNRAPQDVTASVLMQSALPDADTMATYAAAGVSEMFALIEQLGTVPVLRWIAEPDPDRPIDEDTRTIDRGNFVHGGFLVWENGRFTFHWTIPAAMWPCRRYPTIPCEHDPFVKGP